MRAIFFGKKDFLCILSIIYIQNIMHIQVCTGKSCSGRFSNYIITRLKNDEKFYDRKDMKISESGCMWNCKKAPNIKIANQSHEYVSPARASELVSKEYHNANI